MLGLFTGAYVCLPIYLFINFFTDFVKEFSAFMRSLLDFWAYLTDFKFNFVTSR